MKRKKLLYIFLLLLLPVYIISVLSVSDGRSEDSEFLVAFLDVGQGDSIFIETPSGYQVIVDGGSGSKVLRELRKLMEVNDRYIDMLIATHPDRDHIGGLTDVLKMFDVGSVLMTRIESDTYTYKNFIKAVENNAVENEEAETFFIDNRNVLEFPDGVLLEILAPISGTRGLDNNNGSIVIKVTYKDKSFLLTGDIERATESRLVSIYDDIDKLKSDVLKVSHHGSKSSSIDRFLEEVDAKWFVISAGENNRYGHPHPSVIDRLKKEGGEILHTKDGTHLFEVVEDELVIKVI